MRPARTLIIIVLAGLLAGPQATQASGKQFTTLNVPQAGTTKGEGTTATDINRRGDVVGYYFNKQGVYGFLLHQGTYTTIAFPGAHRTLPASINRQGDIVGYYSAPGGTAVYGFLLRQGKYTSIRIPKAWGTGPAFAGGINTQRDIVGQYIDRKHVSHGFLLHQGRYTKLDHPKAATKGTYMGTYPARVNDQGAIVGSYVDSAGVRHGFLLHHGTYTTIDAPGAAHPKGTRAGTAALGINAAGDIVGMYSDRTMLSHGFLLHQGTYTVIDHPRAAKAVVPDEYLQWGSVAYGISPQGAVVGAYTGRNGVTHGFLWR